MYSLITFASQWGSKHGGINSFNTDFLTAFGVAYHLQAKVVCIVASATPDEIDAARNAHVTLVPLPYPPQNKPFSSEHAEAGINELNRLGIRFDPEHTIWLGHDRISGAAANAAVKIAGGRSALIHHMSYDHYESYAENSATAYQKSQDQATLFLQADLALAVGPLLRDALTDLLRGAKPVHMLIPGLADIKTCPAPKTFTAFLCGRLSDDAARIKQGYLVIAALSQAHREARDSGKLAGLSRKPKLVLRGIDFESTNKAAQPNTPDPETELKKFAEGYANGVINLQALPYTQNRDELHGQLSASSVALMPSWHEGFGLVAWEAIAAGVPLIISKDSGVYQLLDKKFPGAGPGGIYPITVAGAVEHPFFSEADLESVVAMLKELADKPDRARKQAGILRGLVGKYTWPACAEKTAKIFGWPLQKGSIPPTLPETMVSALLNPSSPAPASPLHMPTKRWHAGSAIADSQMLRAEEALVPFDPARRPDLDTLNAWLDDTRYPHAMRLITGAGGLGKTRLALELCQQRLLMGWHAGLLDNDLEAKAMDTAWQTLRNLNQPLLIVIDYAETRQPALLALVKAMLQNAGVQPARLLLLARDGGEWWDNLPGKDKDCESFLAGYATSGPYRLSALHDEIQDRRQAYQLALQTFAQALGAPAPEVAPELAGDHFGRPLYLQMAALLALHGERPTTAQGLTKALLYHERRYWQRSLAATALIEPERYAEQLLALTTLAGGFPTPKSAQSYWIKASGNALSTADFNPLFHALEPLYPGKQGLQAVRPDLLGEALVAQALLRPTASDLLDAVLANDASEAIRRHALTVLARLSAQHHDLHETLVDALARHFAHCCHEIVAVATETSNGLPVLAEAAFFKLPPNAKSQVAGLLKSLANEESVQLNGFYCLVHEYLAGKYRQKLWKKPKDSDAIGEYAGALNNYAVALYRIGRNDLALSSSLEALTIFGKLNRKNEQRFGPGYASSLNNYANSLSDAGQNAEALDHARQALEIRQRLALKDQGQYEPGYATSLSNYANRLSDAGQDEAALEHARQALEIRQRLALKDQDQYEPGYAMSLSNYANCLSDAGQNEAALEHARQALEIRQRLAQKNPDRYEPDYAMSLSNYASHLRDSGQDEAALEHARQALEIRQRLAQKNPDRYEPDYATSLSNYAGHLRDAGQDEAALEHARQALEINQRLAQKNLDRYEPDYATSLNNYASHLRDAGQDEAALQHARQALEINQRLAQKNLDRHEPDYAMSLSNYASHLSDAGQDEEALEHAQQALEIRQRLAQKYPDRYEPGYATSLNNYASHLSDAGQDEAALEHARQALEIRQRLAQKTPDRFAEDSFSSACATHFLEWLNGHAGHDRADLATIPEATPPHRRTKLLLYKAFVQACQATQDPVARANAFKQALILWDDLSPANRTAVQNYWLCAAAWCAKFEPSAVENLDWQANWRQFLKRRNGRLPCWMQKLAQRLALLWPE